VPRIFLSHSSHDNRSAIAVKTWLATQDNELNSGIFLDIDPQTGLRAGRWKEELRKENSRCEAIICLLSKSWESSAECITEYRNAEDQGKLIIPVRLEAGTGQSTKEWQHWNLFGDPVESIDIGDGEPVQLATTGLRRLYEAIRGAGIGADHFPWPPTEEPDRAPYRGWDPFEERDAAVFYGRDAALVQGLDALRQIRLPVAGNKKLFVVLGPSGVGKSSFLRAGLLPRLRREDTRFTVLNIVRPRGKVLSGDDSSLAVSIDAALRSAGVNEPSFGEIKIACAQKPERVCELLAQIQQAASARLPERSGEAPPTLVLPLDQAEELFSIAAVAKAGGSPPGAAESASPAATETDRFLELIASLARGLDLIVVATIRTDHLEALQTHPALAEVGTVLFNELKPMPATQFKEVITGPAQRATNAGHKLDIAPALVNRLLADASQGADTLPLLSLTLWRLFTDYRSTGELTLDQYVQMGGLSRVVQTAIDEVLSDDAKERTIDPAHQLAQLRAGFIPWLATINPDNDQRVRRVARWSELPEESRPLIKKFVEKRLLVSRVKGQTEQADTGGPTEPVSADPPPRSQHSDDKVEVEVALESLLDQWTDLAGWLNEESQHLKTAEEVERQATAWKRHNRDREWLVLSGTRLADAEKLADTPEFRNRLADAGDFLASCRQVEDQKRAAEDEQRRAELRHAQERQQAAEAVAAAETEAREKAQQLAAAETEAREDAQEHAAALRKRSAILAIVAIIAVIGLVGAVVFEQRAHAAFVRATAERVGAEALGMLNRDVPGGDMRAIQEALAALSLSDQTAADDALAAAVKLSWASKVISPPGPTETAAYSPTGDLVVSGGFDGTVRLWNTGTGEQILPPPTGHDQRVTGVAFSPDGRQIASVGQEGQLRVWDVTTHQEIMKPVTDPDGKPGSTVLWTVAYSPDGKLIATGDSGGIRLWDARTLQPGRRLTSDHLPSDQRAVYSVAFSPNPDVHILASGGRDGTVRLWDPTTTTGAPLAELTGHADSVLSVAFRSDGRRLASAGADTSVFIWNEIDTPNRNGHQLVYKSRDVIHAGHSAAVNTVAFSNTGNTLISGSVDGTIRWWDLESEWSMPLPATRRGDNVQVVAFRPGTFGVLSCRTRGGIQLWDNLGQAIDISYHTGRVTDAAFSPDGKYVASSSADKTVTIWDIDHGQQAQPELQPVDPPTGFGAVTYSPGGSTVAAAGWDGKIYIWDVATGVLHKPIDTHTRSVGAVTYSPNGDRIVSADGDNNLQRWEAATGAQVAGPMKGHTKVAQSVAYSRNGKLIASGGDDMTIRLWSADTGAPIGQPLKGHSKSVFSVAFSPDSRRLVSGSLDGTVREWDIANPAHPEKIGEPMVGHAGEVHVVTFSPDGRYIASGGEDGTSRIWNADSRRAVGAPLSADWDQVYALAFSRDGTKMVSGGSGDHLNLWPLPVDPKDSLCRKITANMSRQHWRDWVSPGIDYKIQCPGMPIEDN
jgi:WD40 repeat protein